MKFSMQGIQRNKLLGLSIKFELTLIILIICSSVLFAQNTYNNFFSKECLRIDYFQVGDKDEVKFIPDEYFRENIWGGNPENLLDTLNLGHFLLKVYDVRTNLLVYSYGFSTLFTEWQTTAEAAHGTPKVIGGTLRIPLPLRKVHMEILARDKDNIFSEMVGSWEVDPSSVNIRKENRHSGVSVSEIQNNGNPSDKVDLTFLGEGYTAKDSVKFDKDARRLTEDFFSVEPFESNRERFNVYALLEPSVESGTNDPASNVYKNTTMNFSFNTFDSQRYLMTYDYKNLNDILSAAPSDVVVVLINTDLYGGGGIYNLYASVAVDNSWTSNILIHEIGHTLAGLGDEYYTSDVAYNNFYPLTTEPWEPNLTITIDRNQLKWKNFVLPQTPSPTPWEQQQYDHENEEYYKKLEVLKQKDTAEEVKKFQKAHLEKIEKFFSELRYRNKIGVFEGAGYVPKGIYRPASDCVMFSNRTRSFDKVCLTAIQKRIHFLSVN
jgi:hypothetical protein